MGRRESWLNRDMKHFWHPCSQMKDYEKFKPIFVKKARGDYIYLDDGKKIIDSISSWWCKSLGHNHPRLKKALLEQLDRFEHVISANTTNETIIKLSEALGNLMPSLEKVFYASEGSSAVEIALKMSLHSRVIQKDTKRTKFMALSSGYHGETLGALSVSDLGMYKHPYTAMIFEPVLISPLPYVLNSSDPLWDNASELWHKIEPYLEKHANITTALILEPIVQGAGGMKIYSQDFLRRLRQWTQQNNIHLIADEIMTGLGRTGKMLACEHADIIPDFICLSKGLTSGWLPLSAVITSNKMYNLFYDDYRSGKSFLHSHTYSGNVLAASIALEAIKIIKAEKLWERANFLQSIMYNNMLEIANMTGKLSNVRGIGAIVAADLLTKDPNRRIGFEVYQKAVEYGALLRPLGNTIYWLPPLNVKIETLQKLKEITLKSIRAVKF